jgi:hypothetical protein
MKRQIIFSILIGFFFVTPCFSADHYEEPEVNIPTQIQNIPTPKDEVETREKDSQPQDTSEKKRVWDHPLPIWGQEVIDRGYDLPLPFGIGVVLTSIDHELLLDNLKVGASGSGNLQDVPFVSFGDVDDSVVNATVKFDAWLFPFLNLFAIAGYVEGETTINADVDLDQAFPGLCGGTCGVRTLTGKPQYSGNVGGLGMNLVGGFKNYFAMINATYSVAEVDIVPGTEVQSVNISPRIGMQLGLGPQSMLALYTGATYLEYDMKIAGTAELPVVGLIDFEVDASEKENWNYLLGANWDITKRWSLQAEMGFGNTRENIISSLTYRF